MSDLIAETVDRAVGQIYESTRNGGLLQILYVDDQIVVLRSEESGRGGGNTHRLERRKHFEDNIEAGFFEYKPDSDLDMMDFSEIDWSEVDYVGEKTARNLHDNGYETALDIQQAEEGDLLEVSGVGQKGATNLREFAR